MYISQSLFPDRLFKQEVSIQKETYYVTYNITMKLSSLMKQVSIRRSSFFIRNIFELFGLIFCLIFEHAIMI